MAYIQQTWIDNDPTTPLSAQRLNHMEVGIAVAGNAVLSGAGSPVGSVPAAVGQLYVNTNGGAGTTLYVKESGGGTTAGWVAK